MTKDCVNEKLDDNNEFYLNEVNKTGHDDEDIEETTGAENEGIIHRYIIENKIETNRDKWNKVIEEFPDNMSLVVMNECVNAELDGRNQHYLIK